MCSWIKFLSKETGYRFIQVLIIKQFSNESKLWFQGAGMMSGEPPSLQLFLSAWAPDQGWPVMQPRDTGSRCIMCAEHGMSISMALITYLKSALQFKATEIHLMWGGRTGEESQGGIGEVSLEVSEARTDHLSLPQHPPPWPTPGSPTCVLPWISKGKGETVQRSGPTFSLYLL